MDVLAHGLWGGALFGNASRWKWRLAFLFGVAPDVFAFGPFLISQWGNPIAEGFPRYVHQSYDVTHSFVVWSAAAGLVWAYRKSFPWVFCAWPLHILCDIPLHTISFFPTPYLWPLATPFVDGVRWAQLHLLIPNYAALIVTYTVLLRLRWRRKKEAAYKTRAESRPTQ